MSHPDRSDPIFAKAAQLPAEILPGRDLWPGIAARLDGHADGAGPSHKTWRWPVALAAGVVMIAVTAAVTWRVAVMQFSTPPSTVLAELQQAESGVRPQPSLELIEVRNDLLGSLQTSLDRLPPQSQRLVVDNLLEIRASLKAIEQALSQDPDDASLQQLLYTTYEQELAMLVNLKVVTQSLPVEVET